MRTDTKKYKTMKAKEIIDRNVLDVPFSDEDWQEFKALTGIDATGAVRRRNPSFPSDPRHVRFYVEGEEVPISWGKAINGRNERSETISALRSCAFDCMREFRDSVDQVCEHCGATENLTVDHLWPPFDTIAQEFIDEYGKVELVNHRDGRGQVVKDVDVEAAWIAYHAQRATYQLLCRSCNASKGKTRHVRRLTDD